MELTPRLRKTPDLKHIFTSEKHEKYTFSPQKTHQLTITKPHITTMSNQPKKPDKQKYITNAKPKHDPMWILEKKNKYGGNKRKGKVNKKNEKLKTSNRRVTVLLLE